MVDDVDDPLSTSSNRSRAAVSVVLVMALPKTHPNYTAARALSLETASDSHGITGYFDQQRAEWNAELPWPKTQ